MTLGLVTVTVPGGSGAAIPVQDEGTQVSPDLTTMNFAGSGVVATANSDGLVTVTVPGGSGTAIPVQDEGIQVTGDLTTMNFAGAGVTATSDAGGLVTVAIPGGGVGDDYVVINSDGTIPTAAGTDAIAIGEEANASGGSAVAFGKGAKATDAFAVAIGNDADASKRSTVAIGDRATAVNQFSVAVGVSADALGTSCVAIGSGASAETSALALGFGAQALFNESGAIGTGATARAARVITIGGTTITDIDQKVELHRQTDSGDDDLQVATKKYVDDNGGAELNVANTWTALQTFSAGLDAGSNKIPNVTDPTLAQDAATKTYVDTADALKANLISPDLTGTTYSSNSCGWHRHYSDSDYSICIS